MSAELWALLIGGALVGWAIVRLLEPPVVVQADGEPDAAS